MYPTLTMTRDHSPGGRSPCSGGSAADAVVFCGTQGRFLDRDAEDILEEIGGEI